MLIVLAAMLGQIGLPGGGFGFGYGSINGMGTPRQDLATPAMSPGSNPIGIAIPVARVSDPAAASRRQLRVQRQAPDLSGHQAGLLGRRQPVPPSPGPEPAGARVPAARHRDRARALVDRDRAPCRHRAAGDHHGRAQRCRRLVARPLHPGDAAVIPPIGQARNDYNIFIDLAEPARLPRTFTEGRDEMGLGAPSLRPGRAPRCSAQYRGCRTSTVSGATAMSSSANRSRITCCSRNSAAIPSATSCARRRAGSRSIPRRSRAWATTTARRILLARARRVARRHERRALSPASGVEPAEHAPARPARQRPRSAATARSPAASPAGSPGRRRVAPHRRRRHRRPCSTIAAAAWPAPW